MQVQEISLSNFRNYKNLQLLFNSSINIIVGKNAQGKTNIIESVYYAATGKSHRSNYDNDLILWGENFFNISLVAARRNGNIKIEIVVRSDGKKIVKVNGQIIKKLSELIGTINAVLFSPEDIMLVKGSPSVRRRFLDIEISQTSPFYCHSLTNYNRILSHRNNLLKAIREKKESADLLEIWDQQLVEYGSYIIKKRCEVIEKIKDISKNIHKIITEGKEDLNLSYKPSVSENNFEEKLRDNRNMEIIKGITMVGPHRDDIIIKIGETDLKAYGSQGQHRTAALSMKLSEIEFMKIETGDYPILLLDDVMSELDSGRRKFLLEVVKGKIQTFITTTGIKDVFDKVQERSRIIEVDDGNIKILQEG